MAVVVAEITLELIRAGAYVREEADVYRIVETRPLAHGIEVWLESLDRYEEKVEKGVAERVYSRQWVDETIVLGMTFVCQGAA